MAVYSVTNQGVVDGGPGDDRLIVTYDVAAVFPPPAAPVPMTLTLTGGSRADGYAGVFDGGIDLDVVFSGIEHFTFRDRTGQGDLIRTGDGDDVIEAGGGDDYVFTGGGQDRVLGGAGTDRWQADLSAFAAGVAIDLNAPRATFLDRGLVRGVEALAGFGNDYVPVAFRATAGNDDIVLHRTSYADDVVDLGPGDDRITAWWGSETDRLSGGAGRDALTLINAVFTGGLSLSNLGESAGGGWSGVIHEGPFPTAFGRKTAFEGFERIRYIDRAGSNDTIFLGGGADRIDAGAGDDWIGGGGGRDRLLGGAGADTLAGGPGDDALRGGAGADMFDFAATLDEGRDRIVDLADGADLIRLLGGSFEMLGIAAANGGADTRITTEGGTRILIAGVAAGLIDAADFVFA